MAISHTLTLNWSNGTNNLLNTVTLTGGIEINVSETVTGVQANKVIAGFQFTATSLLDIVISCDTSMTFCVNTTQQATFTVTAGKPFVWYSGSGVTNPFSTNVTTLYANNPVTTTCNLDIRALQTTG